MFQMVCFKNDSLSRLESGPPKKYRNFYRKIDVKNIGIYRNFFGKYRINIGILKAIAEEKRRK